METLKGIFYAGLALVIVVALFFLSSLVGMVASVLWLASWLIAWTVHNIFIAIVLVVAVYCTYKWLRAR